MLVTIKPCSKNHAHDRRTVRPDSPEIGQLCAVCRNQFVDGDEITMHPLGPGFSLLDRMKYVRGEEYSSIMVVAHYGCVTGETCDHDYLRAQGGILPFNHAKNPAGAASGEQAMIQINLGPEQLTKAASHIINDISNGKPVQAPDIMLLLAYIMTPASALAEEQKPTLYSWLYGFLIEYSSAQMMGHPLIAQRLQSEVLRARDHRSALFNAHTFVNQAITENKGDGNDGAGTPPTTG